MAPATCPNSQWSNFLFYQHDDTSAYGVGGASHQNFDNEIEAEIEKLETILEDNKQCPGGSLEGENEAIISVERTTLEHFISQIASTLALAFRRRSTKFVF